MKDKGIKYKFAIQLILGKLEFDGNTIESFNLLDRMELVPFEQLEGKLTSFYNDGIEKIKEVKKDFIE